MILCIEGRRDGYAPSQIGYTMTVGEFIEQLKEFDESEKVMLYNDNGFTFGSITPSSFEERDEKLFEDGEDEEE